MHLTSAFPFFLVLLHSLLSSDQQKIVHRRKSRGWTPR
jgi:hypothetical protein